MTTKEKRLMIKSTTKRWSDVDLVEVFNNGVKDGKQQATKDVLKILDECADKTDIWDNERWDSFKKMFKKQLSKLGEEK